MQTNKMSVEMEISWKFIFFLVYQRLKAKKTFTLMFNNPKIKVINDSESL